MKYGNAIQIEFHISNPCSIDEEPTDSLLVSRITSIRESGSEARAFVFNSWPADADASNNNNIQVCMHQQNYTIRP